MSLFDLTKKKRSYNDELVLRDRLTITPDTDERLSSITKSIIETEIAITELNAKIGGIVKERIVIADALKLTADGLAAAFINGEHKIHDIMEKYAGKAASNAWFH